jgi:hypothetical protein
MSAIQILLDILGLKQLEMNLFRGRSPQLTWQRVFGGQVIGQALVAACRTIDVKERPTHSLHAYFLLAGDPQGSDHLRCRARPRRQELRHAAGEGDPARAADLHHVGIVPPRGDFPHPPGQDARRPLAWPGPSR